MDNEASTALKRMLQQSITVLQLAPHRIYRQNAAKRSIRTFKDHFMACIFSVYNISPIYLWCCIVNQAYITINLLQTSQKTPRLSAYAQLFGAFYFNASPMVPPGTKLIAHEKPNQHASWSKHGLAGWYIGPALQHYRFYRFL